MKTNALQIIHHADARLKRIGLRGFRGFLLLALLPHLVLAIYLGNNFVPYPDQDAYLSAANNMLAGGRLEISFEALGGFVGAHEPTSYYGIGAPLLYAAQIAVFGENYFLLRIGNILVFALSLYFFRGICALWMPERIADFAMLVMGFSPFFIIFNQLFLTEMPFLCCQLGAFFFLFRYLKFGEMKDNISSSVFLAFSILVRTNLLFFLPVIALAIALKISWSRAFLYVAIALLVVSPYCIRNCINNRAFFPFDGKPALNLWMFNSDVHQGGFLSENFEQSPVMPEMSGLTEKQRADTLSVIAKKWIEEHPAQFIRFAAMKAVRFFSPFPQKGTNQKFAVFLTPYSLLLMVGFAIGVFGLSPKNPSHVLVVLLFLYTLAIEMVFMAATRHRILFDPFFILVAFNYIATRYGWTARQSGSLA